MGLFGKAKNPPSYSSGQTSPLQNGLQRIWTRAPTRDKNELPELYHKNPRLDPITVIGKAVASTPWKIYDKLELRENGETAEPILDHDLYDLLDFPMKKYPEIDGYALLFITICLKKLVGECYWIKVRERPNGPPTELYPIPPAMVPTTPTKNNPYFMVYPFGVTAGQAFPVPQEDMIWFKSPDLNDPYSRGRGESEQLEDEIQTDEYFAKMQKNFAYNDATPPFIMTMPGAPAQSLADAKKDWMQKVGGWMHHREPGFVGFDARILQLSPTMVEMDFINSRKYIRDEATEHYQIPPEIFGRIENCHDEKTECLTRKGWKQQSDLTLNDKIATWNIEKECIEYQTPSAISRFDHDGIMHHWEGGRLDVLVTPGHRMLRMDKFGDWKYITSEDHAKERGWFQWRATGGKYEGRIKTLVIPPHISIRATRRPNEIEPNLFNPEDFAYFLGAFISEGYVSKTEQVYLSQNAGIKAEKMKNALSDLKLGKIYGRERIVHRNNINCEFYVTHKGLSKWLREEVKSGALNKRIPSDCFEWSKEARLLLLEGLMDGDGSVQNGYCRYGTSSKLLADDIQRLCIDLGFVAYISYSSHYHPIIAGHEVNKKTSEIWMVMFRFEPNVKSGLSELVTVGDYCSDGNNAAWKRDEYYKGIVWCVTVPNSNFFTRRNGRVICHGNSNRSTINSAFYLFNKNVISYELKFLERVIDRQLIAPDFDKNTVLRFDQIIDEDEDFKLSVMNSGIQNGTITVDEWRKAFNMPTLPNGKGDVRHLTFSVMEIKSNESIPEPVEQTSEETPTEQEETEEIQDETETGEVVKQIEVEIIKDDPIEIEIIKKEAKLLEIINPPGIEIIKYSPDQPRDEQGRFGEVGGGDGESSGDGNSSNITASNITSNQANDILSGSVPIPKTSYVHGIVDPDDFESNDDVREFTQDIEVAKQYSGYGQGSVMMITPNDDTIVCNFTNTDTRDMDELCNNLSEVYDTEKDYAFKEVISQIQGVNGKYGDDFTKDDFISSVREGFVPDNIVTSAGAFDNREWISLLGYAKGTSGDDWPDFCIVPNGGGVLLPSSLSKVDYVDLSKLSKTDKAKLLEIERKPEIEIIPKEVKMIEIEQPKKVEIEIIKYNENHDEQGRFATGDGGISDNGGTIANQSSHWQNEETVVGEMVIETNNDFDTESPNNDQVASYARSQIVDQGLVAHIGSDEDIEDITVTSRTNGTGYIMISYEITPSKESGESQLDETQGSEEYDLYHELGKITKREIEVIIHKDIHRDERKLAIWKAFDARATSHEGEFISAVDKYASKQSKLVKEALKKNISDKPTDKEIDAALDSVFTEKEDKVLKSSLAPAWIASMESGREHAYDVLGNEKAYKAPAKKPSVWDVTNELFNEWIEGPGLARASEINLTTYKLLRDNLKANISEAISQGLTGRQIAKTIYDTCDGIYDEMTESRAKKIGRTESCATTNYGSVSTYKESGVEKKTWLSTQDSRCRDTHIVMDDITIGIDEEFEVGSDRMIAPGLGSDPAENVNCRCTTIGEV
ncbi:MAG: phage portal protein [Candidatus Nanoarchaeia archaeon]|nr:phage portal protein [Candidatus Nanoarchaeia archaeon]